MAKQNEATTRAKAAAFDRKMAEAAADTKTARQRAALQRVAASGTREAAEAKRILGEQDAAATKKAKRAESAALPRSIKEAGDDAKAYARADIQRQAAQMNAAGDGTAGSQPSRANMVAQLRAQGIEPVGG